MNRHGGWLDAGLYAAAAVATVLVLAISSIPLYREWARIAAAPYAAAAVASAILAPRRPTVRVRALIAVLVGLAALAAPLAAEVVLRAGQGPGSHAQSEAIVTELAARALVHGRDPYGAAFLHGALAARPLSTRSHFPYLPGMLAFGLPAALGGGPFGDARIWFTLAALVAGWAAIAWWPGEDASGLLVGQVLLVLPTGALFAATGGDDLPVLALMALALVLVERDRPVGGGLALGAAMALKQTAWILAPFLLLAVAGRRRGGTWRFAAAAAAIPALAILPFALWNAGALVEDVVRFPAGLSRARSAARTPSLGSMLERAVPGARPGIALAIWLVVLAVGLGAAVVVWRRARAGAGGGAAAALGAAAVFAVAVLLAPQSRIGYVMYPANLLAWWLALRDGREDGTTGRTGPAGRETPTRASMVPPGGREVDG